MGPPCGAADLLTEISKPQLAYLAKRRPDALDDRSWSGITTLSTKDVFRQSVMAEMLRQQLLDTSRGRIVTLLQAGNLTADDVATKLGLTRSAVRAQITAMERDGVVQKAGKRPGTTRPSHVYALSAQVEQLLSKAYVPLLTHLVGVFAETLPGSRSKAAAANGHQTRSRFVSWETTAGGVKATRGSGERDDERASRCPHPRRSQRQDRDSWRQLSARSTHRQASRRLSRDGESRDGDRGCAGARMLRSRAPPSMLF